MSSEEKEEVVPVSDIDLTDDKELMMQAVDFVLEKSDGHKCPICDNNFGLPDDGNSSLRKHLRVAHGHRVFAWFVRPELGADAFSILAKQRNDSESSYVPKEDISVGDEYDNPNLLHVSEAIKRKYGDNGYLRWVRRDQVRRRRDQRYELVEATPEEQEEARYGGTETTEYRSHEMVLMVQPKAIRERHVDRKQRLRQERAERLPARIENKGKMMTDLERQNYDILRSRKMDHTNAYRVAKNAANDGRVIVPGR